MDDSIPMKRLNSDQAARLREIVQLTSDPLLKEALALIAGAIAPEPEAVSEPEPGSP